MALETTPQDDDAAESLLSHSPDSQHSQTEIYGSNDIDNDSHVSEADHFQARRLLYTSHFLSAWNSRVFEFGAFLFLANIFPGTLLPASVYALSRSASAAVLSPWIGRYIDQANRLVAVRISIVGQRLAVALSCIALFLMLQFQWLRQGLPSNITLAVLALLACVEKLCSVLNTISAERDFVVVVAGGHEERLALLNSQMRRIDLFCKLVGPLTIAFIDGASAEIAVIVTGAMTLASVLVEYFSIARVYRQFPALQVPKTVADQPQTTTATPRPRNILVGFSTYIQHRAFLPSFALALLYLTVLAFSGQMITYLLALGLSSGVIGLLRGVAAVFELSATWLGPQVIKRIGPTRAGIWFINWQIFCVVIACVFFWVDESPLLAAAGTVGAVIASRIGLWGFDLSAQMIVQEEVEEDMRGLFSSQEFALQNTFEMLAFASTIVFPKPAEFKYPATISAAAVGLAGILYALFVRSRRGHLVHLSSCIDPIGHKKDHKHWYMLRRSSERVRDDDDDDEAARPPYASDGRNT